MRKYKQIGYEDRKIIEAMYSKGIRISEIARELDSSISSVYRELKLGFTGKLNKYYKSEYDAETAQKKSSVNSQQKGKRKNEKKIL